MAKANTELPRDVQSDLHDMADEFGEKIARGTMVQLEYSIDEAPQLCTCKRYSKRMPDGRVKFANEPDPDCKYTHLTPLAKPFSVKPA